MEIVPGAGTDSEQGSGHSGEGGGRVSAHTARGGNTQRPPRPLLLMGSLRETPGNSAGHAIMKVDNTTSGVGNPTFGRPSIKIMSNETIPAGSLVIMDAVHMPFGVRVDSCSLNYLASAPYRDDNSAPSGPRTGLRVPTGQMTAKLTS